MNDEERADQIAQVMFYHGGKYADLPWLSPENDARREAYLEEARAILPLIREIERKAELRGVKAGLEAGAVGMSGEPFHSMIAADHIRAIDPATVAIDPTPNP